MARRLKDASLGWPSHELDEAQTARLEVLRISSLTSTKGQAVRRLEEISRPLPAVPHAVACASGTAAVHSVLAALDFEPGDEIVTTSVTDIGALTPILYQGVPSSSPMWTRPPAT